MVPEDRVVAFSRERVEIVSALMTKSRLSWWVASALMVAPVAARADLTHESVSGRGIDQVEVGVKNGPGRAVRWASLSEPKKPDLYTIRFRTRAEAVAIPHCNGRERIIVDGAARGEPRAKGPVVVRLDGADEHEVAVDVRASTYEKRVACSGPIVAGVPVKSTDGVSLIRFSSPQADKGGGEAVVFVPGGHDVNKPAALLVGTHPWNGSPWTYAAYEELLDEAGKLDVVLLMPSGLGNSLYVADAEDEVMRAIDAVHKHVAIDDARVSIWGASMGGAGATTIGFHHPDRFAFIASYFGDSRYDLTTYVRGVLGGEEGARRVNALDVLENARHVPVHLVHGEIDRSSPVAQSTMLYDAMKKAGFTVSFDRVTDMGHEGPLVVRFIRSIVEEAAAHVAPRRPSRVSYRSVRPSDTSAYGITITKRAPDQDAFVDLEGRDGKLHVLAASGISRVTLATDALGIKPNAAIVLEDGVPRVEVTWEK